MLNKLLGLTNLGEYRIKCYLPVYRATCSKVIGPIGNEVKEEEIKNGVTK